MGGWKTSLSVWEGNFSGASCSTSGGVWDVDIGWMCDVNLYCMSKAKVSFDKTLSVSVCQPFPNRKKYTNVKMRLEVNLAFPRLKGALKRSAYLHSLHSPPGLLHTLDLTSLFPMEQNWRKLTAMHQKLTVLRQAHSQQRLTSTKTSGIYAKNDKFHLSSTHRCSWALRADIRYMQCKVLVVHIYHHIFISDIDISAIFHIRRLFPNSLQTACLRYKKDYTPKSSVSNWGLPFGTLQTVAHQRISFF